MNEKEWNEQYSMNVEHIAQRPTNAIIVNAMFAAENTKSANIIMYLKHFGKNIM